MMRTSNDQRIERGIVTNGAHALMHKSTRAAVRSIPRCARIRVTSEIVRTASVETIEPEIATIRERLPRTTIGAAMTIPNAAIEAMRALRRSTASITAAARIDAANAE